VVGIDNGFGAACAVLRLLDTSWRIDVDSPRAGEFAGPGVATGPSTDGRERKL